MIERSGHRHLQCNRDVGVIGVQGNVSVFLSVMRLGRGEWGMGVAVVRYTIAVGVDRVVAAGAEVAEIGHAIAVSVVSVVREGAIRMSPHLYNTPEHVDVALNALARAHR